MQRIYCELTTKWAEWNHQEAAPRSVGKIAHQRQRQARERDQQNYDEIQFVFIMSNEHITN